MKWSHVGDCRVCGKPMVSTHAWKAAKSVLAPRGWAAHHGRQLCSIHWERQWRTGSTGLQPKRARTAADVEILKCRVCGVEMVYIRDRKRFPELEKYRTAAARDLCKTDYTRLWKTGSLERRTRSADEVLDEWVWLRDDGCTDLAVAAKRMGMTLSALDMALYRARKKGDPRGSRVPFAHDMRRAA